MTIKDIIEKIDQDKDKLNITLYPPAYISEIEELEEKLKINLPDEIKTFYRFTNGFLSGEDLFRIIPIDEVLKYANELNENEFYIAEYMIYSDTWVVSLNPPDNSYQIMEHSFKTVLTNSFAEFLQHFFTGGVFGKGGLYEWKDQIDKKKSHPNP
jgi:hypothetical protein